MSVDYYFTEAGKVEGVLIDLVDYSIEWKGIGMV